MKYNVCFEMTPNILTREIEAPNKEVAEDIAWENISEYIKVKITEATE